MHMNRSHRVYKRLCVCVCLCREELKSLQHAQPTE